MKVMWNLEKLLVQMLKVSFFVLVPLIYRAIGLFNIFLILFIDHNIFYFIGKSINKSSHLNLNIIE